MSMVAEAIFVIVSTSSVAMATWFIVRHGSVSAWPVPLYALLCTVDSWLRVLQIEPAALRPDSNVAMVVTIFAMGLFLPAVNQSAKKISKVYFVALLGIAPLVTSITLLPIPGIATNTARLVGGCMTITLLVVWLWIYLQPLTPGSVVRKRDVVYVVFPLFVLSSVLKILWPEMIVSTYSAELNTGLAVLDFMTISVLIAMSSQDWPLNLTSMVDRTPSRIKRVQGDIKACFIEGERIGTRSMNNVSEFLGAPIALVLPGQTIVSERTGTAIEPVHLQRKNISIHEISCAQCYLPGPDNYTHSAHTSGVIVIRLWSSHNETEKAWLLIGKEVYERYDTVRMSHQLFDVIFEIRNMVLQDAIYPRLQITELLSRNSRLKARLSMLLKEEAEPENVSRSADLSEDAINSSIGSDGLLNASVNKFERRLLELSLETTRGVVSAAATLLGLDKVRMGRLMKRHQVSHENYRSRRRVVNPK